MVAVVADERHFDREETGLERDRRRLPGWAVGAVVHLEASIQIEPGDVLRDHGEPVHGRLIDSEKPLPPGAETAIGGVGDGHHPLVERTGRDPLVSALYLRGSPPLGVRVVAGHEAVSGARDRGRAEATCRADDGDQTDGGGCRYAHEPPFYGLEQAFWPCTRANCRTTSRCQSVRLMCGRTDSRWA